MMKKNKLLFIFLPVALTTIGEFFLKFTLNSMHNTSIVHVFLNPWILLGLGSIFVGGVLWLVAMSKFELSFIYPFLSINYVAIVIGSQWILGEEVSLYRYLSIVLIIAGLIFISRSPFSES